MASLIVTPRAVAIGEEPQIKQIDDQPWLHKRPEYDGPLQNRIPPLPNTIRFLLKVEPRPTRAVSVEYETTDATAKAASDYVYTRGILTFRPHDAGPQVIEVPI